MPSPFPGMNPYFEQPGEWHSFHLGFLVKLSFSILASIPEDYDVDYGHSESVPPHRWLMIGKRRAKEVTTVIEVLTPALKGKDRKAYLDKREAIFSSDAHFVEIDLLRGEEPMPFEGCPASDYRIAVSRAVQRPTVEIWPFGLRDPLPVVPLPLREGEPELPLDLKAVLDSVYDGGHSERSIYQDPPEPPLSRSDAAWAKKILAAAAKKRTFTSPRPS